MTGYLQNTKSNLKEQVMLKLRQIEQDILAKGKIDKPELELLRRELYAGGKIDRQKADFLVELHKRVQHMNPAFQHFFYQAIKDHILADGDIDTEEAAWLRQMLFADGKIDDEEGEVFFPTTRGGREEEAAVCQVGAAGVA